MTVKDKTVRNAKGSGAVVVQSRSILQFSWWSSNCSRNISK